MKKLRFVICMLILGLASCSDPLMPRMDIKIEYEQTEFSERNVVLQGMDIEAENGRIAHWSPGTDTGFDLKLPLGTNNITVRHGILFPCGETVIKEEQVSFIKKTREDYLTVTAGSPVFRNMETKTLVINPEVQAACALQSMKIILEGGKSHFSRNWLPGDSLVMQCSIYEPGSGGYRLHVAWEVKSYKGITETREEQYPIPDNNAPIAIGTGPFANTFLSADNPGFFFINNLSNNVSQFLNEGISVPLPAGNTAIPVLYYTHTADVIVNLGAKGYFIYCRNPDGTYSTPQAIRGWPGASLLKFTGDFNNDAGEDLFMISYNKSVDYTYSYQIAHGLEKNLFDFTGPQVLFFKGAGELQTEISDFNQDGNYDLLYCAFNTPAGTATGLYVLYGKEDGTLENTPHQLLTTSTSVKDINVADINNDGYCDIILGSGNNNKDPASTALFLNNRACGFSDEREYLDIVKERENFTGADFFAVLDFADLNTDGWLDMIAFSYDHWVHELFLINFTDKDNLNTFLEDNYSNPILIIRSAIWNITLGFKPLF